MMPMQFRPGPHQFSILHNTAIASNCATILCNLPKKPAPQGSWPLRGFFQKNNTPERRAGTGVREKFDYDNPVILPSAFTSILAEDGIFGKPGMVMTSPQIITMYSAPAASRTSRMLSK